MPPFDQDTLDEFRATFFDECTEYLLRIEDLLDALRGGARDRETLDAVFRIAHSIKAGAAAFGLDVLASLTHRMEAVLDRLRSGARELDGPMLELLVDSGDALVEQVEVERSGSTADPARIQRLVARLEAALAAPMGNPMGNTVPAVPSTVPAVVCHGPRLHWRIDFRPTLSPGSNEPLLILRALATLGPMVTTLDASRVPDIERFDPEVPVLAWHIDLDTDRPEADIREVFEFIEDEAEIVIALAADALAADDAGDRKPAAIPAPAAPVLLPGVPPVDPVPAAEAAEAAGAAVIPVPAKAGTAAAAVPGSIRVDLDRVDRLVDMVGELVITEAVLAQLCRELDPRTQRRMMAAVKALTSHSRKLQDAVMAIRMQPVKSIFARMPRMARDLAGRLGKKVELHMAGEATEVDKTVIEELADPLTHMIRNALDHGIESPAERVAAGKPETGTVTLSAEHRGGRIVIQVEDDGRGIDRPRVLNKARAQGIVAANAELSDEEIDALLFAPGFSTAEAVTDVSGRGVGMDVVQRNIQGLGGRIGVQSEPGRGTRWTMTLPLTLAVLDGMLVRVADETYVIPLSSILESTRPKPGDVREVVGHGTVVHQRGDWLPLVRLADVFGLDGGERDPSRGIVVRVETETAGVVGLVVDELLGQQQVVVKSIEQNFTHVRGVAATTILGNGLVCLILDLDECVAMRRTRSLSGVPSSISPSSAAPPHTERFSREVLHA